MTPKPPDRRRRILSAALQCFNEHGVEAAAIGDICAGADASVGSVYHHFGNKEGIVQALLAEGLRSNMQFLEPNLRRARSARQGVHVVVHALIEWVAAHPDWARFIYANLGKSNRSANAALAAINAEYAQLIETFFAPHLKAGAFRRLPRECWAPLVLGPVHDYARRWLNGQVETDIAAHADVFADAAWNAVRNPDHS